MKLLWATFILLLLFKESPAQTDILLLQRHGSTVKTWIRGSYIRFQFINQQWIEGIITKMQNDSIWVSQMQIRRIPDRFGFPTLDTARFGILKFHVTDIRAMPRMKTGGSYLTNGTILQVGSAGYILLNIFNGWYLKEPIAASQNIRRLITATSVFVIGTVIKLLYKPYLIMGGRYKMKVINIVRSE